MTPNKHRTTFSRVKHYLSSHKKKYLTVVGVTSVVILLFSFVFFITKGINPHISELAFIEHSVFGSKAGSVIPASCDSNGDGAMDMNGACPANGVCAATRWNCAAGTLGGTAGYAWGAQWWCNGNAANGATNALCTEYYPTAQLVADPPVIAYGGTLNDFSIATQNAANNCEFYGYWDGDVVGGPWYPIGSGWRTGTIPNMVRSLNYYASCFNASWDWVSTGWVTAVVQPQIPSGLQTTCLNAAGTSARISWNASDNTNLGYYLRVEVPTIEACPSGWQRLYDGVGIPQNICYPNPDSYMALDYTQTRNAGQVYNWYVYARNDAGDSGSYSSPATVASVCYQATGNLSISSPTCTIATGDSSCSVNATWSTSNPFGTSQVQKTNPNTTVYTANTDGGVPRPVTVNGPSASSLTTISLLAGDGTTVLDSKTVSAACEAGDWDTVSGSCRDPQVVSAILVGQYYPLGRLTLTCSGSNSYSVLKGGAPFIPVTPYNGTPIVYNNFNLEDNYTIRCMYGSIYDQVTRFYDATPGAPIVKLNTDTTLIDPNEPVVLTWDTVFPTDACTLTASVVCANNACTADQLAASSSLNAILSSSNTDPNDPSGSRPMSEAIKEPAPGHKDIDDPIIAADYKALGKKTVQIKYTTDLIYECGGVKQTKRIRVAKSEEQ